MASLRTIAQLRALLVDLEAELGLLDLSTAEKDVFYAISEVATGNPPLARSEAIRAHALAAVIPQATYHRALRTLMEQGFITRAPDSRAGLYMIADAPRKAGSRLHQDTGMA